jgi:hypothetical protein
VRQVSALTAIDNSKRALDTATSIAAADSPRGSTESGVDVESVSSRAFRSRRARFARNEFAIRCPANSLPLSE